MALIQTNTLRVKGGPFPQCAVRLDRRYPIPIDQLPKAHTRKIYPIALSPTNTKSTSPVTSDHAHSPVFSPVKAEKHHPEPAVGGSSFGSAEDHIHRHHMATLWVYWSLVLCGAWLLFSPVTFGYGTGLVAPSGNRETWLSRDVSVFLLTWNDVLCGLALMFFGYRTRIPDRPVSLWLACGVGLWLNFAPLLFWAPTAAGYVNDTLIGVLAVILSIVIPGLPNMKKNALPGPEIPPGWSFNPSSWTKRFPLIFLTFMGWMTARYLAGYQLGYHGGLWDPVFGDGSRRVLTSNISGAIPVSDAGLGAMAYSIEFLLAWTGGRDRWRTSPWVVTLFGILVIPVGLVSITLVILQPVAVGSWCFLCLGLAFLMLLMIPLEASESLAVLQFLGRKRQEGASLWRTFWRGGSVLSGREKPVLPHYEHLAPRLRDIIPGSLRGVSFPWPLVARTVLGGWMMLSPAVLGFTQSGTLNYISGALVITFSIVAMGEPIRTARLINLLNGIVSVVLTFILSASTIETVNNLVTGVLVIALSIPRGPIREQYGNWTAKIQ